MSGCCHGYASGNDHDKGCTMGKSMTYIIDDPALDHLMEKTLKAANWPEGCPLHYNRAQRRAWERSFKGGKHGPKS